MFSGRPLSLHEARLPQCSREMYQNHDWIIPRSGGRPWLERPPFPHWITVATSTLLGQHCDSVWVVRLPAALMGCVTILLTAWIASVFFGRQIGLCSGLILATAFEFYEYASLAEDDIFLAALVVTAIALFVRAQFAPQDRLARERTSFFGWRPWPVVAFFAVLGLTNLAKGPLVGAAVVIATLVAFLPATRDPTSIRRFLWSWGWLIFGLLTVAWPWAVYHRYPEVMENWRFDYAGTSQYNEPFWHYPYKLLGELPPWTPLAFVGLAATAKKAARVPAAPERFLWCWAIVPILLLSIPHRKHHHYLVPILAPWAILASIGLVEFAKVIFRPRTAPHRPFAAILIAIVGAAALLILHKRIPGPLPVTLFMACARIACISISYLAIRQRRGALLMTSFVCTLAIAYCWGQSFLPDRSDETTQDTQFLKQVAAGQEPSLPLYINSDLHCELDFFRISFYLPSDARLLHNLSYLRDEKIHDAEVYIITPARDRPKLETLGQVDEILQSGRTRREKSPADRFTLFKLKFGPELQRYPAPTDISTMQAMGRKTGPWCGPPL